MKALRVTTIVMLTQGALIFARAGGGILNLTTLANYANQPVPNYLVVNRDNTPANNPITDKGATLGRVLFYDKRLSRNDTISCASCHQQAHAFGDTAQASTGVNGTTGRHAMRLVNSRFANEVRFFWDERATSLENQTTQPIQNHIEMGFSGTSGDPAFPDLVTKLSAIDEYRVLFALTFGDASITEARVQRVLAQFVRSIQSFDSRFDVGRARVAANNLPFPNFTASENNGKQLFLAPPPGGAGCAGCHRPPEFDIDPASLNNGVITSLGGGSDLTNTRAPSLRDIVGPGGALNGGLMHDGSFTTLAQVINHYSAIPANNTNLDPRLRGPGGQPQNLNLLQQARNDLAAFLLTLTGSAIYSDPKWSNPFNAQGQLALIVLPAGSVAIDNHGDGTATISCAGVPGLPYLVRTSTNLIDWTTVATVAANASGLCAVTVSIAGNVFYQFAYEPPASSAAVAPVVASLAAATPSVVSPAAASTISKAAAIRLKNARKRR